MLRPEPLNITDIAEHIDRLAHLNTIYNEEVQALRDLGIWIVNPPDGIHVFDIDTVASALGEPITESVHKPGWAFYRGFRRPGVRVYQYVTGKIEEDETNG